MIKTASAFWCASLCALTFCNANAVKVKEEDCGRGPQHMRVSARYTTPQGIGYNTGYTTIEGFFAPRTFLKGVWLPFLDVRGHAFDNGTFAANAGLGLRYLAPSRVWGVNAYYDYRNTSRQDYNQISAGLESLGRVWDFRINGYLPVGEKQSHFFHTHFAGFKGHNMLIRRARDFAMKGANAEAGIHVDHFKKAPLYFAGGPYYLTGIGETTWGGELRGTVDLFHRYLRLEGNVAYDHFFKWTGQARISVNIPFGGRSKVAKRNCGSCSKAMALQTRAVQRIDRFEIIPVGREHVTRTAIDPATGKPFVFLFRNNRSSLAGAYDSHSPYLTVVTAQDTSSPEELIYVFSDNGSMMGMNAGMILQDDQMLPETSTSQPLHLILRSEVLRVDQWLRQKLGSD